MRQPLGQHFLKIPGPARMLVKALSIKEGDTVVEIGPGHGELTRLLVETPASKIICIEKDVRLAAEVVRRFATDPRITVLHGDVREVLPTLTLAPSWKLAGNIPYYLTSFLVRILSDLALPPERAALLMQKEVAERINALPGSFTKLAAFTGAWATTELIGLVPKTAFSPPPRVESAILSFIRSDSPVPDRACYDDLVRRAFTQPRKMLVNNLIAASLTKEQVAAALTEIGLTPQSRPQDLSVEHLVALTRVLPPL